jgi:hypothetical protein
MPTAEDIGDLVPMYGDSRAAVSLSTVREIARSSTLSSIMNLGLNAGRDVLWLDGCKLRCDRQPATIAPGIDVCP